MKTIRIHILVLFASAFIFPSCNKKPVSCFTYEKDGYEVSFNSGCSENAEEYFWEFDSPGETSISPNPTYTFPGSGTYDVTLRVTNKKGSSNTFSESIVLEPSEVIRNGGFEELSGGFATNWTTNTSSYIQITSDQKKEGNNSIQIYSDDFTAWGQIQFKQVISGDLMKKGTPYILSFWVKHAGLETTEFYVINIIANNSWPEIFQTSSASEPAKDWTYKEFEFIPSSSGPISSYTIMFDFQRDNSTVFGTPVDPMSIWIDEIMIRKK